MCFHLINCSNDQYFTENQRFEQENFVFASKTRPPRFPASCFLTESHETFSQSETREVWLRLSVCVCDLWPNISPSPLCDVISCNVEVRRVGDGVLETACRRVWTWSDCSSLKSTCIVSVKPDLRSDQQSKLLQPHFGSLGTFFFTVL